MERGISHTYYSQFKSCHLTIFTNEYHQRKGKEKSINRLSLSMCVKKYKCIFIYKIVIYLYTNVCLSKINVYIIYSYINIYINIKNNLPDSLSSKIPK